MYRFSIVISLLFLMLYGANGQMKRESGYLTPLKIPISFSGGFGELRKNHFHTGLDFRTAGQIGLPVFAVKEGSVARVSVSPSGYGHALYLLHPDGHTTVYGHLSRFDPKIESYVIGGAIPFAGNLQLISQFLQDYYPIKKVISLPIPAIAAVQGDLICILRSGIPNQKSLKTLSSIFLPLPTRVPPGLHRSTCIHSTLKVL